MGLRRSLLTALLSTAFLCSCALFFIKLPDILAKEDPWQKADIIYCLSGSSARIDQAETLLAGKYAAKIVMTTKEALDDALRQQIPRENLEMTSRPAKTTWDEGMLLKEIVTREQYKKILVVTDSYHIFRSRWTIQTMLAGLPVQCAFVAADNRNMQGLWWENQTSRQFIITELVKIAYYYVWHGLMGQTADPRLVRYVKTHSPMFFIHI